jgi:hypothetical protein
MRSPIAYYLFTLGTLWLGGQGPVAQAGVGAAPVAGIAAPSQKAMKAKQGQRTPSNRQSDRK